MVNWPPTTAPIWPPLEIQAAWLSCSDLRALLKILKKLSFTPVAPTTQERNTFFQNARCDHSHTVTGRMLVSPDSLRRYPFAVCNNAGHRDLLVLWPPYYAGWGR